MSDQRFLLDRVPERFVEVDAARLLLILAQFSLPPDSNIQTVKCLPKHTYVRYFTPQYYLQKLDFLLRYPGYFVYELTELYRLGQIPAINRAEIMTLIRSILANNEPELLTTPFRKFWRGAYERLDDVENWWHSRELVYVGIELRAGTGPQKYYFLSALALSETERLINEVSHGRWYADRIALIHRFFGRLSPAQVMALQYKHQAYRDAQIAHHIPDLSPEEIAEHFMTVFGEDLEGGQNA